MTEVRALDALSPETHPAGDATHFRRIIEARRAVDKANAQQLHRAVDEARAAGDSWAIIGAALDTTRQAACQCFGQR